MTTVRLIFEVPDHTDKGREKYLENLQKLAEEARRIFPLILEFEELSLT